MDLPQLTTFTTGEDSFSETIELSLISLLYLINSLDLPQLTAFETEERSFYKTTSLRLASLMN